MVLGLVGRFESSPGHHSFSSAGKELRFCKGLSVIRFHTAVSHLALAMPRPFTTKSGCYDLNVGVSNDLREVVRGRRVTLPIAGESVTVTVSVTVISR